MRPSNGRRWWLAGERFCRMNFQPIWCWHTFSWHVRKPSSAMTSGLKRIMNSFWTFGVRVTVFANEVRLQLSCVP